jgi:formylmethanofuran dehydrogenase subunit C
MDTQAAKPRQANRQPPVVFKGFKGREPARESVIRLSDFSALWDKLSDIKNHNDLYNATLSSIAEAEITAADVEKFCKDIRPMQGEEGFSWRAGIMLSALVNSSVDSDFIIPVKLFNKHLSLLAYRNRKNVYIDGDAGDGFAAEMEEGIATVRGNVYGSFAAYMVGGTAIAEQDVYGRVGPGMSGGEAAVKGDVGVLGYLYLFETGEKNPKVFLGDPMFAVGLEMSGGFISIEGFSGALTGLYQKGGIIRVGYAGSLVGSKMEGGEIYIENDYDGLSPQLGKGKIFFGDKQIHPKKKNGEDKVLAELLAAWEAIPFDNFDIERSYNEAFELAQQLQYSGDDIGNFSRALELCKNTKHFHTKAGIVLSALINAGEGLFYNINVRGVDGISKLGFRNSKIIRVRGNLGPHAGAESLEGSSMIVEGNVGYAAGAWGRGALLVTGDAEDFAALGADGGYVQIVGNAGKHVAELLDGGCVYVHGEMENLGNVQEGIVQNGDEILIHTKKSI